MSTFVYILVGLAVLVLLCLLFLYLNKAQTEARPNGKYRLKSERYDGWEERAWYNEKIDTMGLIFILQLFYTKHFEKIDNSNNFAKT